MLRKLTVKIFSLFNLILFVSNMAIADCVWSEGIKQGPGDSYIYSLDCHLKVGTMKRDLDTANQQVNLLNQSVQLKDLALQKSDERIANLSETNLKLMDRVNSIDENKFKQNMLYFAIGALGMLGAGFMASKLIR